MKRVTLQDLPVLYLIYSIQKLVNIIANYWAGMTASLENYFYCLYEGVN